MTQNGLDEKLMHVKGAVTMAYPEGLPIWDTLNLLLDSDDGLSVRLYHMNSLIMLLSHHWIISFSIDFSIQR